MSHRSHAEFILVGFILGLISADPFIFHHFICLSQLFPLERAVFGEFLGQSAVLADCSSLRPPLGHSLTCALCTPSETLTLQTALNISSFVPLKHEVKLNPRELLLLLITAHSAEHPHDPNLNWEGLGGSGWPEPHFMGRGGVIR